MNAQKNERINSDPLLDLDSVNIQTVRDALRKLKPRKSDVYFGYNSNCFINAPDTLREHVTHLFKWFQRNGKIPFFLLAKDNLSDISASDNYRATAIGSLMLK